MRIAQLNGKQVKYLRCPRNGKQVLTHLTATVSNHGKAMCLAQGLRTLRTCEPGYRPVSKSTGDTAGGSSFIDSAATLPSSNLPSLRPFQTA
jgi:hypothetical protein